MDVQSPKSKVQSLCGTEFPARSCPTLDLSPAEMKLLRLYERWRSLSGVEFEAIQARDWTKLSICQEEKKVLASEIAPLDQKVQVTEGQGRSKAIPRGLQPLIRHLISLESQNAEALASMRQALAEQQNAAIQ